VFPKSTEAVAALIPGPKDTEHHERRTQHQADAPHNLNDIATNVASS
jgi:hypothetical protein